MYKSLPTEWPMLSVCSVYYKAKRSVSSTDRETIMNVTIETKKRNENNIRVRKSLRGKNKFVWHGVDVDQNGIARNGVYMKIILLSLFSPFFFCHCCMPVCRSAKCRNSIDLYQLIPTTKNVLITRPMQNHARQFYRFHPFFYIFFLFVYSSDFMILLTRTIEC